MREPVEYRVVWRWREVGHIGVEYPVRRKVFLTRRGANRLIAKLRSNGGRFDATYEHEPSRYDDGLTVVPLRLDFAVLQVREVGPWATPCVCGAYVSDSSGGGGCGNCGADSEPFGEMTA